MHGYIATGGTYCYAAPVSKLLVVNDTTLLNPTGNGPSPPEGRCYLYPNPTTGEFLLAMTPGTCEYPVTAQIYNAFGVRVKEVLLEEGKTHRFSLADEPPGIYFLLLRSGNWQEVLKVIRR
jgi:hypothetical protein